MPRWIGDLNPSQILDEKFLSTSDGKTPGTLAGTPVISVFKDNITTPSTAGVTVTPDFHGVTGLVNVHIDTSADTSFYSPGSNFHVTITTGTVGGVSVVGATPFSFSIHNRGPRRRSDYFRTRKYGVALGLSNNKKVRFQLTIAGAGGFADNTKYTPAAGDFKLSKDGGAQANVTTLPSYSNGAWELELSGTELQAEQVDVSIIDAAPKAIDDCQIVIETYGSSLAMYPDDVSSAGALVGSDGGAVLSASQTLI